MTNKQVKQLKKQFKIYTCTNWQSAEGPMLFKIRYCIILPDNKFGPKREITGKWVGCRWQSLYNHINTRK